MKENLQHSLIEVKNKVEKYHRISRFFHQFNLKILADKHQQAKDPYAKRILRAYGLCKLSEHLEDKYAQLVQERPKRNFLLIDVKKFSAETEGLTACEKLLIISLASSSCREGNGIQRLLLATYEIKNLMSGSLSKSFIKLAMRDFSDLGIIGVIRKGRFRWQGHTYSKSLICLNVTFLEVKKTVATLFRFYTDSQGFFVSDSQKNKNTSIIGPPALTEVSKDCFILEDDHSMRGYREEERHFDELCKIRPKKVVNLKRNEALRRRFILGGIKKNWATLQEIGFSEEDRYWNKEILAQYLDGLVLGLEADIRNPVRFFIASYKESKTVGKRKSWAFENFIKSINAMTSTVRHEKTIHIDRRQAEKNFGVQKQKEEKKAASNVSEQASGLKSASSLFGMFTF